MATQTMVPNDLSAHTSCREQYLYLNDNCMSEPIDIVTFPPVDPTKMVAPLKVAANDAGLTTNAINVVDNTAITNVLFPSPAAEKDVFILVNQSPQAITLKTAVADLVPAATLRGGSSVSFRYIGGVWTVY